MREETRAEWSSATAASGSLAASAGETTRAAGVGAAPAAAAEASIAVGSSRLCCWETAAIILLFGEERGCFVFSLSRRIDGGIVVRERQQSLNSLSEKTEKKGRMATTTLSPFRQTAECVFTSFLFPLSSEREKRATRAAVRLDGRAQG